MKEKEIIPGQEMGGQTDIHYRVDCRTPEEAKDLYQQAKKNLLDINHWYELAEEAFSEFKLTDDQGNPLDRSAAKGDFLRINLPGPGSGPGEGYDWVRIESITESGDTEEESFTVIQVRPTYNPQQPDPDTAHFFTDEATSSFMVKRKNLQVSAEVHGRNEVPNAEQNKNLLDKIRNILVGTSAIAGLSSPQWKKLVKGLLVTRVV